MTELSQTTPRVPIVLSLFWLRLVAALLALLLCIAAFFAWRADRRDRAQLAAELASTKQLLAATDARQHDRDKALAQTLAALATQKRSVVTAAQIVRELPKNLPLPAPVTLQADHASSVGAALGPPTAKGSKTPAGEASLAPANASSAATAASSSQSGQKAPVEGAFVPAVDLKPLYDFTLDCQACQAKLSATQSDLADEKAKTAALTKERDDALRIAKGGSAWRRFGRAVKWFLIGAAAGAVLAKSPH